MAGEPRRTFDVIGEGTDVAPRTDEVAGKTGRLRQATSA